MINTSGKSFAFLVNALFVYAWVSINIYLPALPYLSHYFNTSSAHLKLSISIFLITFALSQLFWGSLSERYGRRIPLIIALVVTCTGVVIAMFAPSIFIFNLGRFIEAIGAGCAPVLGRALLLDCYDKTELAEIIAIATIFTNIMPALSPIIGGYLLIESGWRSIFLFLFVYGFILLSIFYLRLPETNRYINLELTLKQALQQYKFVFTRRTYWGYLIPYNLATGGMLGYYAATPFIFIEHLHIPPNVYGYLSIVTVVTYIMGAWITRKLTRQWGIDRALIIGLCANLTAALLLSAFALLFSLSVATVLIPMSLYTLSAGIISPNSNAGAMQAVKNIAGAGNAIVGASVYAAGSLLSFLLTNLNLSTLTPLALYTLTIGGLSFFAYISMIRLQRANHEIK